MQVTGETIYNSARLIIFACIFSNSNRIANFGNRFVNPITENFLNYATSLRCLRPFGMILKSFKIKGLL